jgi:uncharacterized protein (TIGR02996 family)
MLVLEIHEPGAPPRSVSLTRHTLGLGSTVPSLTLGWELGLSMGGVLPNHAQLFERDGCLHLVSHGMTTVNGRETTGPSALRGLSRKQRRHARAEGIGVRELPLEPGAVIGLGEVAVVVRLFVPIVPPDFDESERDFLVALDADPASIGDRLVYADALEDRGWLIRAEYLRVQLRILLGDALEGDVEAKSRYEKNLFAAPRWMKRIGEPTIADACKPKLGPECPVAWGREVRPTLCPKCGRSVRYPVIA